MTMVNGMKYKVKRIMMPPVAEHDLRPDFKAIEDFLNSDEMDEFVYIVNVDATNDKGQTFTRYIDVYYKMKVK